MKHLTLFTAFVLGTLCIPAKADSIAINYSLTGTGTVTGATATTLTIDTQASGSFLSSSAALNDAWNPVSESELCFLNLTTSILTGNFTLTFADGDTLTGQDFENQSAIGASQTGPFTQILTFTGGTGEFAGATGSVSGDGFLGLTDFTISGSGTLDAPEVPEPASATLFVCGFGLFIAGAWRSAAKRAFGFRTQLPGRLL